MCRKTRQVGKLTIDTISKRSRALPVFRLARVLVRFDHVASCIINANHSIILLLPYGAPAPDGNSRPLKSDGTLRSFYTGSTTGSISPIYPSDLGVELNPSSKNDRPPHPTGVRGGCSPTWRRRPMEFTFPWLGLLFLRSQQHRETIDALPWHPASESSHPSESIYLFCVCASYSLILRRAHSLRPSAYSLGFVLRRNGTSCSGFRQLSDADGFAVAKEEKR